MPSRNEQKWMKPPALKGDEWVDSRIYTDPEIFEDEMEKIWSKIWLPLCHESELPEPFDFRTFTIAREPVVVCRGCLLEYPPEARDPLSPQPNCQAPLVDESGVSVDVETPCYPGQDDPVDCRVCRVLLTSRGDDEQEVERSCEPGGN